MPDMTTQIRTSVPVADVRRPNLTTPADLDRGLHVWQSRFTGGRSPSTVALACLDWGGHAANAPFQTADLGRTAVEQWARLMGAAMGQETPVIPKPDDRRFARRSGALQDG